MSGLFAVATGGKVIEPRFVSRSSKLAKPLARKDSPAQGETTGRKGKNTDLVAMPRRGRGRLPRLSYLERFKGCQPLLTTSNLAKFQFGLNHYISSILSGST